MYLAENGADVINTSWGGTGYSQANEEAVAVVTGLGAVLVPFPSAADDHQTSNAEYFVAAGAAVMIPQARLTPELLAAEIESCISDRQMVMERAVRARSLAKPEATREVTELCFAVVDTP